MLEAKEVLSAFMDGGLKKVSACPDHGHRVENLRFDRDEVFQYFLKPRQVLGEVGGLEVLKQRDAAKYLKVKTATIPYLMALGLLDSHAVANPVIRRKQSVVSVAALDAFMGKYISVSQIAAQYETHTNVVLDALRRVAVFPIYDDCGVGVSRFLRRRELECVSLDIPKRPKRNRRRSVGPA